MWQYSQSRFVDWAEGYQAYERPLQVNECSSYMPGKTEVFLNLDKKK
jgi:hypothetical protein